jgi:hypothetical protein
MTWTSGRDVRTKPIFSADVRGEDMAWNTGLAAVLFLSNPLQNWSVPSLLNSRHCKIYLSAFLFLTLILQACGMD